MKKVVRLLAPFLVLPLLSGCFASLRPLDYDLTTGEPDSVMMSSTAKGKILRHFSTSERAIYLFGGKLTVLQPDLKAALKKQAGAQNVASLKIHSEQSALDQLLQTGIWLATVGIGYYVYSANVGGGTAQEVPKALIMGYGTFWALNLLAPEFQTVTLEGDVVQRMRTVPAPTPTRPQATPVPAPEESPAPATP